MDVRCERCRTEYEVEDARLSDLGTEVQCSDCGHLFTVKRPSPTIGNAALPVAADDKAGTTWKILNTRGQTHEVRDLTELHKWIIEKRVSRSDQVSMNGQPWQFLGSLPDLVPFFDIVDSAERARALDAATSPARLVPLQPPMLLAPRQAELAPDVKPRAPALAQVARISPSDSLGAVPQPADIGETEMLLSKRSGGRMLMKVGLMVVVAAGIGYGGIRWQKHYLRPATISTEAQAASEPKPTFAASTPIVPRASEVLDLDADVARRPVVHPLESPVATPEPPTAATRGYASLGRRDYRDAVVAFKQALAENSVDRAAIFGLAEAYRGLGERMHALRAYHRYVTVAPFGPEVGSARLHIRALEKKR